MVRVKHLWPRALLTPFTDDVDLTHGDRRTYADAAEAQRAKGFENVDVSFDHDGQNATARRSRAAEPETEAGSDPARTNDGSPT